MTRGRALERAAAMTDFYLKTMRAGALTQLQHRASNYMFMLGMIAEPVIYLVVWTRIAEQRGGSVGGYDAGRLAAYYIVWTLVRNMNLVFTPYGFEWRIRTGEFSAQLLRPVHPIHGDIAEFGGWKFAVILLWVPIAVVLSLIFRPTLSPTPLQVVVFAVAIWGAYLVRTVFLWLLGMITFWTTRASAFFELYVVVELLLSGRLVPMSLMPDWAQHLAGVLPFQSSFGFPIQALVSDMPAGALLRGLAMQLFWIVLGAALLSVVWRRAVRRYSAVGS